MTLAIPRAGEHLEQRELSFTAGGNVKWDSHLKDSLALLTKPKQSLTVQPAFLFIMGWFVLPQKHVEILTPSTPEHDLVWKQGLYRAYQVKMKSVRWTIIEYDWCPYKKKG